MAREIKFRVWDHKHKTMGRVIGWSRYDLLEEIGNVVYYVNDKTSLQPTDSERIEIMQYTGLKDKNGVEIYEGDVVTALMETPPTQEEPCGGSALVKSSVIFKNGEFFVSDIGLYSDELHTIEVIGNIYENPELLEIINEQGND